jgi:hypothetical protein
MILAISTMFIFGILAVTIGKINLKWVLPKYVVDYAPTTKSEQN